MTVLYVLLLDIVFACIAVLDFCSHWREQGGLNLTP